MATQLDELINAAIANAAVATVTVQTRQWAEEMSREILGDEETRRVLKAMVREGVKRVYERMLQEQG